MKVSTRESAHNLHLVHHIWCHSGNKDCWGHFQKATNKCLSTMLNCSHRKNRAKFEGPGIVLKWMWDMQILELGLTLFEVDWWEGSRGAARLSYDRSTSKCLGSAMNGYVSRLYFTFSSLSSFSQPAGDGSMSRVPILWTPHSEKCLWLISLSLSQSYEHLHHSLNGPNSTIYTINPSLDPKSTVPEAHTLKMAEDVSPPWGFDLLTSQSSVRATWKLQLFGSMVLYDNLPQPDYVILTTHL